NSSDPACQLVSFQSLPHSLHFPFPLIPFAFLPLRTLSQIRRGTPPRPSYTSTRNSSPRPVRPSDLSRELQSAPDEIVPPEKVTRLLAKVTLALAQGRITRREAGVFTNLCNLLIQSSRLARGASISADPEREHRFASYRFNED
ncbi:MAG TPA: hypothetical protein VL128_09630, partial [Candidatus Eisenbacteria bacterium]|nr:hypothetical protein [Candidatus Eisenbacteria bacterium]